MKKILMRFLGVIIFPVWFVLFGLLAPIGLLVTYIITGRPHDYLDLAFAIITPFIPEILD